MQESAVLKILTLILALCLVVGAAIGVARSLSVMERLADMQADVIAPSTEAQDNIQLPPPETVIMDINGKPVVTFIYPRPNATEPPAQEELDKLTIELMVTELMQSNFPSHSLFASSPDAYEFSLRNDVRLMAILRRAGGPAALVDYYKQNKDKDIIEASALESLFNSETFKEAVGQEEYERLRQDEVLKDILNRE